LGFFPYITHVSESGKNTATSSEVRSSEKGLEKFLKIKKMSGQKYLEDELPLNKEQS
jgi:hypothetical protein